MVKEIKASFAYSLGEKFALEVAFHDICALSVDSGIQINLLYKIEDQRT